MCENIYIREKIPGLWNEAAKYTCEPNHTLYTYHYSATISCEMVEGIAVRSERISDTTSYAIFKEYLRQRHGCYHTVRIRSSSLI